MVFGLSVTDTWFFVFVLIIIGFELVLRSRSAKSRLTSGEVVAKRIEPARMVTDNIVTSEWVKEGGGATVTPVTRIEGDRYILTIRGRVPSDFKRGVVEEDVEVSADTYLKKEVGDCYDRKNS